MARSLGEESVTKITVTLPSVIFPPMAHAAVLRVLRRAPTTPTTVHALFAGLSELDAPAAPASATKSVTYLKTHIMRDMVRLGKVDTQLLEDASAHSGAGGGVKGNQTKARFGFVPAAAYLDEDSL